MECKQTAANVQINCIPASPNVCTGSVEWNSEMSDVQLKAVIGEVAFGFGYRLKQEQEVVSL